jgi:hypothetical protein
MPNDIAVRIAKQLAKVIQVAKPKAKVYHYWILGQGPLGESFPDMMSSLEDEWKTSDGKYSSWPHAYVIGYDADNRSKIANATTADLHNFRLWGFYGFMKGDASKNSADIARTHWADIQDAISAATKLQIVSGDINEPDGVPEIARHMEWQLDQMGVYWMGKTEKCHIVQGEITFETKQLINPTTIT